MNEREKGEDEKGLETVFVTYDADNLPYQRLCICDIIRDLPELSPEDVAGFKDT